MPLQRYRCELCGYERDSFKKEPKCNHNQDEEGMPHPLTVMKKILVAPDTKFLEPRDPTAKEKGRSVEKGQNAVLKARSRNHARDVEMEDLIQTNDKKEALRNKWIDAKGNKRKKIDDL